VLLGIGGPERGLTLAAAAATPANRMLFGLTVSRLLLDYGLDGISIDWLDQNDTTEAHNFVLLLLETRKWLNIAQQTRTGNFTLAVASPGRPSSYALLYINQMDRYIDFWNLHTFGYKDPRSRVAAHQANIYSETKDSELDSTPYSSKAMVDYFVAQGVDKRKVVLSMPLVGFLYPNTSGPGSVYSRVNAVGYVDYVELPPTNATEYVDDRLLVSYSYDVFKRHFISYDNPAVALMKARWIRKHSLGGGSWWESRADAPGNRSLIQAFAKTINVSNLDSSQNMLAYPDSPYVNLRGGMPEY
jgi:chitinase